MITFTIPNFQLQTPFGTICSSLLGIKHVDGIPLWKDFFAHQKKLHIFSPEETARLT